MVSISFRLTYDRANNSNKFFTMQKNDKAHKINADVQERAETLQDEKEKIEDQQAVESTKIVEVETASDSEEGTLGRDEEGKLHLEEEVEEDREGSGGIPEPDLGSNDKLHKINSHVQERTESLEDEKEKIEDEQLAKSTEIVEVETAAGSEEGLQGRDEEGTLHLRQDVPEDKEDSSGIPEPDITQ